MDIVQSKLTFKQEKFCILYAGEHFGNGVQAYGKAYGIDITTAKGHRTARVNASRLLTNANINRRMSKLLAHEEITEEMMKKHIVFMVSQFADLGVKLGALKLYYRMTRPVIRPDGPKAKPQITLEQLVMAKGRVEQRIREESAACSDSKNDAK